MTRTPTVLEGSPAMPDSSGPPMGFIVCLGFSGMSTPAGSGMNPWAAEVVREFWTKPSAPPGGSWMLGFDTPSQQHSSAGKYFSPRSVGHLGFTGTSFWFDLDQEILIILLTNRVYPTRANERLKSFRPLVHNLVMEAYQHQLTDNE